MLKEIFSWLKAIIIALIIVFVVREFLVTPSIVKGDSMMPNLNDGDRIIISKISSIDRFDEIAFIAPDKNENYVKRVIGLPGDEIEVKNDLLYVNGEEYEELYLADFKELLNENQLMTPDFTLKEKTGCKYLFFSTQLKENFFQFRVFFRGFLMHYRCRIIHREKILVIF